MYFYTTFWARMNRGNVWWGHINTRKHLLLTAVGHLYFTFVTFSHYLSLQLKSPTSSSMQSELLVATMPPLLSGMSSWCRRRSRKNVSASLSIISLQHITLFGLCGILPVRQPNLPISVAVSWFSIRAPRVCVCVCTLPFYVGAAPQKSPKSLLHHANPSGLSS